MEVLQFTEIPVFVGR